MEIQDHELAARTTDPIGACMAGVNVWRAIGVIVLLAVAASVSVAQTQEGQQAQDADQAADFVRLDLNAASGDDFRTIPGVGNRMVREFMEYRPYVSIRQFRREIGKYVSDEQVAAYEQYVYVPVDPNSADAETLMQLTGVDEAIAEALIEARPYASADAILERLAASVELSDADIEQAGTMLTGFDE
jgi:DNA uptake protein ComE-like DNA-binding protein